jgi:hypothetical protein
MDEEHGGAPFTTVSVNSDLPIRLGVHYVV